MIVLLKNATAVKSVVSSQLHTDIDNQLLFIFELQNVTFTLICYLTEL